MESSNPPVASAFLPPAVPHTGDSAISLSATPSTEGNHWLGSLQPYLIDTLISVVKSIQLPLALWVPSKTW